MNYPAMLDQNVVKKTHVFYLYALSRRTHAFLASFVLSDHLLLGQFGCHRTYVFPNSLNQVRLAGAFRVDLCERAPVTLHRIVGELVFFRKTCKLILISF
jgi:hypothetical protein